MLIFRHLWDETWASAADAVVAAAAAERSPCPWAAAEQSELQSDLNVFMTCECD